MLQAEDPIVVVIDNAAMVPKLQEHLKVTSLDDATDGTASVMSFSSSMASMSSMASAHSFAPRNPTVYSFLERTWEPVKADLLQIVGEDEEAQSTMPLFRSLHEARISSDILKSLALLSTTTLPDHVREECVERFALYLASTNHSYHTKLGCIRTLMVLTSPIDASWQLEEGCLKETLEFLIERQQDWVFPEHSEALLLWELRAKSLRFSELSEQDYRIEVEDVIKGGEVAAEYIAGAAQWVERGLKWSVPVINCGLETAGDKLKAIIVPQENSLNAEAVANCTSAAKQATDEVRLSTKRAVNGIRNASTVRIQRAAKRFEDEKMGQKLVPDEDHREVLAAAGKVGIASLGAATIVAEAIFDTTKAVTRKTVSVTADVVRYKYGDTAGQIIQDTSDTTENIMRTIAHVATFEARVLTKSIVRSTNKRQFELNHEVEKGREEIPPHLLILDPTKANAQAVVDKLKGSTRRATLLKKAPPTTTRV